MFSGEASKLKFRASVEYWAKMDVPVDQHGDYVVLELNGNEVHRWKISKLDAINLFNERASHYVAGASYREVDEDGLSEFVARKFSEVFGLAFAADQG